MWVLFRHYKTVCQYDQPPFIFSCFCLFCPCAQHMIILGRAHHSLTLEKSLLTHGKYWDKPDQTSRPLHCKNWRPTLKRLLFKVFHSQVERDPPHPPQSKLKLLSVRSPWKASLHVEKRTVGIVLQLADGKTAGFPSVDSQHSYLRLALFSLTPPPSTLSKKEGFILWKSQ